MPGTLSVFVVGGTGDVAGGPVEASELVVFFVVGRSISSVLSTVGGAGLRGTELLEGAV